MRVRASGCSDGAGVLCCRAMAGRCRARRRGCPSTRPGATTRCSASCSTPSAPPPTAPSATTPSVSSAPASPCRTPATPVLRICTRSRTSRQRHLSRLHRKLRAPKAPVLRQRVPTRLRSGNSSDHRITLGVGAVVLIGAGIAAAVVVVRKRRTTAAPLPTTAPASSQADHAARGFTPSSYAPPFPPDNVPPSDRGPGAG